MKKISFTFFAILALFTAKAQHVSKFDDLPLAPSSYYDGSDMAGGFLDGNAFFYNSYDTAYGGSWSGFAYSNMQIQIDTINSGVSDYLYQYFAASDSGATGSKTYGICYTGNDDATIRLKNAAAGHPVLGMYVNNSAYDYLSMAYGDAFAKKFGGATGTDPDWFLLTINGWYQGSVVSNSVKFYLADFRDTLVTNHYIVNSWQFVNLTSLGNVDSLFFTLTSSDTGQYGMNTPAYFDLDNFTTTDGAAYTGVTAVNDSFSFVYMDTITAMPDTLVANILANDTFTASAANTVSIIGGPLVPGAQAYLDANHNLVYVPAPGIIVVDTVTYTLCDPYGFCSTAEALIYVNGPLGNADGISEVSSTDFHMYPNPASSRISVFSNSQLQSLSVIDMSGREVMQADVHSNAVSLDVSALSTGVYSVLIHTADGIAARRLVKE